MEFEFRHRARTFRLMAEALGVDAAEAARLTAGGDDDWVMDELAQIGGRDAAALGLLHARCARQARTELIREIGDPTPHRPL